MPSCRDMTKLISDSLDKKLSVRNRLGLWFHIMMCGMCRRFRSNIITIRKRVRESKSELDPSDAVSVPLPPATKARLEDIIQRRLD